MLYSVTTNPFYIRFLPTVTVAVICCLILLLSSKPYYLVYVRKSNKTGNVQFYKSLLAVSISFFSEGEAFMEVFVETLKVVCYSEYPNIPMTMAGTILPPYGGNFINS